MTRGWLLNEIFRRAEPRGRTIGEFLRTEISEPLRAGVHIGSLSEDQLAKVSQLKSWSLSYVLGQSLLPYALGSKVNLNTLEMLGGGFTMWRKNRQETAELKQKGVTKPIQVEDMDIGKGNCVCLFV